MKQLFESKLALGSDCTIFLVFEGPQNDAQQLIAQLWREIYLFERRFSRFIPESELSQFNTKAGVLTPISDEFHDILTAAKHHSITTGELYNPFILPALQRAGYIHSQVAAYKDDPQLDFRQRTVTTINKLYIERHTAEIPYGTALDLGGCGKGYIADLLSEKLMPDWVKGYWISLGGDIICCGSDLSGQPWTVAIGDGITSTPNESWNIVLDGSRTGVATSSTALRKGINAGKSWHHLIDPITLKPSETDIVTATVVANSAIEADVFASCAILVGSDNAIAWLKSHGAQGALLHTNDDQYLRFGSVVHKIQTSRHKEAIHA